MNKNKNKDKAVKFRSDYNIQYHKKTVITVKPQIEIYLNQAR